MTNIAQQQELRAKIWKIANDVRGSVADKPENVMPNTRDK